MSIFKASYTDRKGQAAKSLKWYVEFKDHFGTARRVPAFKDKRASTELENRLEALVACTLARVHPTGNLARWLEAIPSDLRRRLEGFGLLDLQQAAAVKPLSSHIQDFTEYLRSKGGTEKHVAQLTGRVSSLIESCGFIYWSDFSGERVHQRLAEMRAEGQGIRTSNFYLQACKQFCRWMVDNKRGVSNPLSMLKAMNPKKDKRHQRRALTADETRQLIQAARNCPDAFFGVSGPERSLIYWLAVETGLRATEISKLTRGSFLLDGSEPTVKADAAYAKGGRDDVLPISPALAEELSIHLRAKLPSALAFNMPSSNDTAKMIRLDLEGRVEKRYTDRKGASQILVKENSYSAHIPYENEQGFADFHALRHTFGTSLKEARVHPKVAQSMMRHSNISLTMDTYTHTVLEDRRTALMEIPNYSKLPLSQRGLATGTDDDSVLQASLQEPRQIHDNSCYELTRKTNGIQGSTTNKKPLQNKAFAYSAGVSEVEPPTRLERVTCGLQNRCSTN